MKMKRKIFIKQIMAVGIPRNIAASVAVLAQAKRMPYFKALGLYLNTYALLMAGIDPSGLYQAGGGAQ